MSNTIDTTYRPDGYSANVVDEDNRVIYWEDSFCNMNNPRNREIYREGIDYLITRHGVEACLADRFSSFNK